MTAYLRNILSAPSHRLALFRIALGAYLVVYLTLRLPEAWGTMQAPPHRFAPEGLVAWLRLESPLATPWALFIYLGCIVCAGLFTWGQFFALTGPLLAVLLLWVTSYKSSFGMLFHSENLFTLQTFLVGFSPAARTLSRDAQKGRNSPLASIPAGWPLLACCLASIFAYLVAGVAKLKLGGFDWATGDILRIQVAYDNLRKLEFGSIYSPIGADSLRHPWLFSPLAVMTLVAELGGILALLHRRIALVWVLLVVGFHWGVLALMAITFSFPMSGVPFLCFFPLEKIRWIERSLHS